MKNSIFAAAGLLCVVGASQNAHAVVLEQKWQAGKTLTYDSNLNGNVNVQIPPDVPFILAGIPLDIEVQGQGKTQLKTLKVDEAGTGTLAVKTPEFVFNAQTFGQTAKLTLRDGKSGMTLNGKPVDWGKQLGDSIASSPVSNSTVQIGKDGRFRGIELPEAKTPATAGATQNAIPASAISQTAMISSVMVQALPSLLPAGDVDAGAKWKADVTFPAAAKNDEQTGTPLPLGSFDMELKGQEKVNGRDYWRIGVKGKVEVDGTKVNALGEKAAPNKEGAAPRAQLESAAQKVDGDIWFDAEAGQVAAADFMLDSSASSRLPGKDGKLGTPSNLDFNGTLQVRLASNI